MPTDKNSLAEQFTRLDNALRVLNFDETQRMNIYRTISGIFFLNTIQFVEKVPNSSCAIKESSIPALETVTELFKLKSKEIEEILTSRIMRVQNENIM